MPTTRVSSLSIFACVGLLSSLGACSAPGEEGDDIVSTENALSKSDPLASAVAGTCDLTAIQGLDEQLVGEIQCLHPGALVSIASQPHLTFEPAVFKYLQAPAADHLRAVVAARGTTLHLNDALRALPEQYVLYHWYLTGRCGIALAASPGNSNHESGLAVDVNDSAGWRPYFNGNGWRWYGASDVVHYDYVGGGAVVDIKGLSVLAFQKLWNLNHPTDKIGEDSEYGPQTEARLVQAPLGGFPLATTCVPDAGAPKKDSGTERDAEPGSENGDDGGALVGPQGPAEEKDAGDPTSETPPGSDNGGCSASAQHSANDSAFAGLLMLGALAFVRRRKTSQG